MKISEKNVQIRKVDDSLSIISLFDGENFAFDIVIGVLNGNHPKLVNKVSDRAYYVLEGKGSISVSESIYEVSKGDLVKIKSGEPHGINGNLKYLIITSPPFDPKNERLL